MDSIITALSFFTNIKMPQREFSEKNYKNIPLLLPLVGLVIGLIVYGINYLLTLSGISSLFHAVLLTAFMVYITGGLHVDGLLDTIDAHFSRRDLERRLEIMHDSNIGVFACVFAIFFFIIKITLINELIINDMIGINLIYIPIISRVFLGLMTSTCKFATEKGLSNMYENVVTSKYKYILIIELIVVLIVFAFIEFNIIYATIGCMIYAILYVRFMYKNYNGITGDILGAFAETSEILMLFISLGVFIWL